MKTFITNLINRFPVSETTARFGIVEFAGYTSSSKYCVFVFSFFFFFFFLLLFECCNIQTKLIYLCILENQKAPFSGSNDVLCLPQLKGKGATIQTGSISTKIYPNATVWASGSLPDYNINGNIGNYTVSFPPFFIPLMALIQQLLEVIELRRNHVINDV